MTRTLDLQRSFLTFRVCESVLSDAVAAADAQESTVSFVPDANILILPKDILFLILSVHLAPNMMDVFSVISACRGLRRRWLDGLNTCAQVLFGKNDGCACKVLLYFQRKGETFFRPADARTVFNLSDARLRRIRRAPRTDGLCFYVLDLVQAMLQNGSFAQFEEKRKCSPSRKRRIHLVNHIEYNNTTYQEMSKFNIVSKLMHRHIREGEEKVGLRLVLDVVRSTLNIFEAMSNAALPFKPTDLIDGTAIDACCNKPENRVLFQKTLDEITKKRIQRLRSERLNRVVE